MAYMLDHSSNEFGVKSAKKNVVKQGHPNVGCINVGGDLDNFHLFQGSVSESQLFFSNGPDDVGRWQRATFKFLHIQGTSIGLVRTNHALLSLVDTNLA